MSVEPVVFFLPGRRVDRDRLGAAVEAVIKSHRGVSIALEDPDIDEEEGELDHTDFCGTLRVRASERALQQYAGATRFLRDDVDEDDEGAEIEVHPGEDGLKARLFVDIDACGRGRFAELVCDVASAIAEQMCSDARVTVSDAEDAEEWARAQDARPLESWSKVVDYLRGEYEVEVVDDDCVMVTCPIFDDSDERVVRAACSSDGEWLSLATTLHALADLPYEDALIENLGSVLTLALNDGDYDLGYSIPLVAVQGTLLKRLLTLVAETADAREADGEEGDEEQVEVWQEGAIVGPWESRDDCLAAFARELDELGWTRLAEYEAGCTSARVYAVGQTYWLSGEQLLVARMAFEHPSPSVFGAAVAYGARKRAESVELWELALDEDGDLLMQASLGVEPCDEDALEPALAAEVRAAAADVGATGEDVDHELVFYRA
jgi:hypothetical protein